MRKTMSFALAMVMLAGCSQEVPHVAEPQAAPAAAATPSAPAPEPNRLDDAHFSVALGQVECAGVPVATATVKWDASGEGIDGVLIKVESPGNERKLWTEGGAIGEATTGPWVFGRTLFVVEAKGTGTVLAQHLVETIPCP